MKKYIIIFSLLFSFIFFYNLNGSKSELKKPKFAEKGNHEIQIIIKGKKIKKNKKVKIKESLEEIFGGKDVSIVFKSIEEDSVDFSPVEQEKQMEELCQKPLGVDQEIVDSINEWCWLSLEKLIALKEIGKNPSDYERFKQEVIKDLGIYKELYSQESSVMELFKELEDYINKN